MAASSEKRRNTRKPNPKQIVYLFGAGATQAEVDYLGARPINLLMREHERLGEGVSRRILRRIGQRAIPFSGEDRGVDIEKLISLLSASGLDSHSRLAERMRQHYFEEICRSLVESGIIERPQLAIGLLEMHQNTSFREEVEALRGIITTNHDGLLQIASQEVFQAVNLGFPFASGDLTPANSDPVPPLLQLHGSFTWKFGVPVKVAKLRTDARYSADTTWIPPTILKESKNYPFNKLTGLAYEILAKQCDVLRVVGASLTQNDWNVLSLIFNAQRHGEYVKGTAFGIELIMSHDGGKNIQTDCSYLKKITPIGFLTEGQFAGYKDPDLPPDSEMRNVFAYWLKEKINYHRRRNELGDGELGGTMAQIVGDT